MIVNDNPECPGIAPEVDLHVYKVFTKSEGNDSCYTAVPTYTYTDRNLYFLVLGCF